jgi:hypothetical protein
LISMLITSALLAQTVARPLATNSTHIAGRVVSSINGDPVGKAVVILRAHDPLHSLSYADETDAEGHFRIGDVAPGEYAIVVDRAGFILDSTGAAGAPGPSVKVTVGQQVDDLAIPVTPLGVIIGQVLDSDAEPARGAKVAALHYVYTGGKKQLRTVAEVEAGDRGDFRLFGLRPGTYYLEATGLQIGPFNLPDKGTATYYPAVPDAGHATPIELRAGAQMRGFDIRLQMSGAHTISFQLSQAVAKLSLSYLLNSQGYVPTEGWSSGTGMGFDNVPPGSYDAVFIGRGEAEKPAYAVRHVEVASANVDGGAVSLMPGVAITGTVRVEGGAYPNLAKLRIHMRSDFPDVRQINPSADVNPNGSFTFPEAAPVSYDLSIDRTTGLYLKSVRMGNQPLTQLRINAVEKLEPLTVVLGADIGELEGMVENAKGDPVAGARVDAITLDRPDFNRSAFSDESGRFKIGDLPPSQYKVFAWENVPDGAPQDPEFRKPFDKQSVSVSIQPKGRANLAITAISSAQVDQSLR